MAINNSWGDLQLKVSGLDPKLLSNKKTLI